MNNDIFIDTIISILIIYYDELKQKNINIINIDNHKYIEVINFIFNYNITKKYNSIYILDLYNILTDYKYRYDNNYDLFKYDLKYCLNNIRNAKINKYFIYNFYNLLNNI